MAALGWLVPARLAGRRAELKDILHGHDAAYLHGTKQVSTLRVVAGKQALPADGPIERSI